MVIDLRDIRGASGWRVRILLQCFIMVGVSGLQAADDRPEVLHKDVLQVTMRDGVRLATDVWRPAQDGQALEGRFPVILTRTPYNKDGNKSLAEFFVPRGYVFVAQDTRGRFASEGTWTWLGKDGPDGADTLKWIADQDWSDGRVGMIGTSYVGGTQHAAAMEGSPFLKTVIPVDAVCNMGDSGMRNGGAFELRFWNWIMMNAGRGSRAGRNPETARILEDMSANRLHYLKQLPLRPGTTPLQLSPEYETWLVDAMRHGASDEFWEQNNVVDHPERYQDLPVLLVGGWYDSWGGNTTATYQALSSRLKSPVRLVMGPWVHGAQSSPVHGQVSFGPEAAIADPLKWRLAWYDRYLKEVPADDPDSDPFDSPVRIFVMGTGSGRLTGGGLLDHGGTWRDESEWPLKRARQTAWYFHAGGRLATDGPAAANAATSLQFDPSDPVPTIGGNISSGNDILLQEAWDQRGGPHVWNWTQPIPLSARNDVLVFRSEPLEEDLEVTGELSVELWASSSAPDTDFTAKLIDEYPASPDFPGGFALNLVDGIRRARFRESPASEKLMTPGEVVRIPIRLYPTSNVFKRGHRIRVDLSSSNFPRFDVNPNSGEPLNEHRQTRTAVNTIHHSTNCMSRILLPVVEAGDGKP